MNDKPVALVTGASSGIGRSAALALARAGYDLVINYASSKDRAEQVAKEAEQLGARAVTAQADVADDTAVRGVLAVVEQEFGRLDALVNNAGTTVNTPPSGPRRAVDGRLGPRVRRQRARDVPGRPGPPCRC